MSFLHHIHDLPNKALKLVLENIRRVERFQAERNLWLMRNKLSKGDLPSCSLVCKLWRRVIQRFLGKKNLVTVYENEPTGLVNEILNFSDSHVLLKMNEVNISALELSENRSVTKLDLSVHTINLVTLQYILTKFTRLENLWLPILYLESDERLSADEIKQIFRNLSRIRNVGIALHYNGSYIYNDEEDEDGKFDGVVDLPPSDHGLSGVLKKIDAPKHELYY
ncbi:hypothetical protein BD770DRAFT_414282 [Pilaira anomala]|nr:hypothetical protein BD770DRAFT_414282 [Pilaira anomala]